MAKPKVIISETDPGEKADRAAADLLKHSQISLGTIKGTRDEVIETIKNARHIPLVWQEVLLAEIRLIDKKYALLRLDMHRHPHDNGVNCTFTIKDI